MLNARQLTLERQALWDELEALPCEARGQVHELVAPLKHRQGRGSLFGAPGVAWCR